MGADNIFTVGLKRSVCLEGLSEDEVRSLVDALDIVPTDSDLVNFLNVTGGVEAKMVFDGTGNFTGIFAKLGGTQVNLFPGVGSEVLQLFKGPPTATNPGIGWKKEIDLTKDIFGQPDDETQWVIFVASRESVINS